MDYYHRAKVPLYVIADVRVQGERRSIELIGYRYAKGGYKRMALDEHGRLWLEPVRLWLGVTRDRRGGYDRLACFDPETGEEVGDYTAIAAALAAEALARAEAEARAAGAEARAAEAGRAGSAAEAASPAEAEDPGARRAIATGRQHPDAVKKPPGQGSHTFAFSFSASSLRSFWKSARSRSGSRSRSVS